MGLSNNILYPISLVINIITLKHLYMITAFNDWISAGYQWVLQFHSQGYVAIILDRPKIEEFSSKIKQIHFWYFWEKQVSLTEFIHMSMGKQNLD